MDLRGGAGGVEFPGLVTIARMLYPTRMMAGLPVDPQAKAAGTSPLLTDTLHFVVAHEVAHQWWNAVVGSHSRLHPFVDEAMANFSALQFMGVAFGDTVRKDQEFMQFKVPYQIHRLMGGQDMPIDQPTSAFDSVIAYSAIVYAKGGLYIDALRRELGEPAFFKGIQSYYKEYAFKIAHPNDFQKHLAAAAGGDEKVKAISDRWLTQNHADEDIGRFNPGEAIPFLVRNMQLQLPPWLDSLLQNQGFWDILMSLVDTFMNDKPFLYNIGGQQIADLLQWAAQQLGLPPELAKPLMKLVDNALAGRDLLQGIGMDELMGIMKAIGIDPSELLGSLSSLGSLIGGDGK